MKTYTETYDFLVSIIGNAPYGIIAIDLEGSIIMCNELALGHLGIDRKVNQIIEQSLADHISLLPDLRGAVLQCLERGRKPFDLNNLQLDETFLNIKGRRILNGMIITTEDVTTTRQVEQAALNAMFEGQEEERQRIAKEIHDGVGPILSTIRLHLDAVKKEIGGAEEKTKNKINSMNELVQTVAADLRGISHALMPGVLQDFGLETALRNMTNKVNDTEQVEAQFYSSGIEERMDQNVELGLYRIAQELMHNALKYASAKTINVQLLRYPHSVLLMVDDDGVGFSPEALGKQTDKGIGLANIQTRVKALNGTFSLDSTPGNGVSASIEIPI